MEKLSNGLPKSNVSNFNPESHLKLCQKIAWQIYKKSNCKLLTLDDLISYGYLGLIRACKTFDPERTYVKDGQTYNIKFSTYAVFWIKNYIQLAIKKHELNHRYSNYNFETIFKDEVAVDREDLRKYIDKLLIKLPFRQREIIISLYFQHKTMKQISNELHCSYENVRRLKVLALRNMRIYARIVDHEFKRSIS